MSVDEIYEYAVNNIKSNPKDVFEKITTWVIKNTNNIGFSDKENYLYKNVLKYLFNFKIGNFSYEEAVFIVNFLARQQMFMQSELGFNKDIKIAILSKEEFMKKYGNSNAVCVNHNNEFDLVYSPKVIENLMSNNIYSFLRGIRTIYHEFLHTLQNQLMIGDVKKEDTMTYSKNLYIDILETVSRDFEKGFYENNYSSLSKEIQAEIFGVNHALSVIKKMNPKLYELYNQKYELEKTKRLKHNMEAPTLTVQNKKMKKMNCLNSIADIMIEKNPSLIDKYPLLAIIYNGDGKRKSIAEIVEIRQIMIAAGYEKEKLDELIYTAANQKPYSTELVKTEIKQLMDCAKMGIGDYDFIYGMLEYRFDVCKISQENRNAIIASLNKDISKENNHQFS